MKDIKLRILSENDLDMIHKATLRVLEEAGIQVRLEEAREIFRKNGCDVDESTNTVKIPPAVVEKALSSVPSHFTLYDREGNPAFEMTSDGTAVHNLTFATGTRMIEYQAPGQYTIRPTCVQDLEDLSAVVDECENIEWFCSSPVAAMELSLDPCRALVEVRSVMKNSKKPQMVEAIPDFVDELAEMQAAARGGDIESVKEKPYFILPPGYRRCEVQHADHESILRNGRCDHPHLPGWNTCHPQRGSPFSYHPSTAGQPWNQGCLRKLYQHV